MKNLLVLLFLLGNLYQVTAQDPQLFENDWFLQKVIINDEETVPPDAIAFGTIEFQNETILISHPNCGEAIDNSIMYINTESFSISGGGSVLLGECTEPDQNDFVDKHFSIYYDETTGNDNNPFDYNLEEDASIISLTVINMEGDQAVYTNVLLSLEERELNAIVFYPNPARNTVIMESSQFLENVSIVMYDVTGKEILTKSAMSFDTFTLDIASFKSGVYFLELKTEKGTTRTEKIIKL